MGRSSAIVFLKKFDRYSRPITLSFKRQKLFETAFGGICSILAFTFLFYWIVVNVTDLLLPPGKFRVNSALSLLQESASGEYPVTVVPQTDVFLSYNLTSADS